MFAHLESLGPVDLAFTDRYGGVSAAPFAELNLAAGGLDDERARAENLRLAVEAFAPGCEPAQMRQVHGHVVDVPEHRGGTGPAEADAMVTGAVDRVLVVRVADCVPVVLAAPHEGVVAVAHAGRPGVEQGVVTATVEKMRAMGAEVIHGWIGPHVCGGCYEVPAAMQQAVVAVEPATSATTTWGTPALDIGAGVRAQLERAGVEVHDVSRCTRESADLYSYRRDGDRAGRCAGLVRIRS